MQVKFYCHIKWSFKIQVRSSLLYFHSSRMEEGIYAQKLDQQPQISKTKHAATTCELEAKFWTSITHSLDAGIQQNCYRWKILFTSFLMICDLTFKNMKVKSNILKGSSIGTLFFKRLGRNKINETWEGLAINIMNFIIWNFNTYRGNKYREQTIILVKVRRLSICQPSTICTHFIRLGINSLVSVVFS